ncbi:MAG: nicotinate phosphoribosyltransferase [Clostridiaceae bacterium]|nr:nicotinate phosphoribosyltransferase [Clostridiaceae bacterium]
MNSWNEKSNMTMLTDFYELTMSQAYYDQGMKDTIAYFDLFFRRVPDEGGYAIMAGLQQMISYLEELHFEEEDLAYLRATGQFSEEFLQCLANMDFRCDVWAVPEGTPIFEGEPIVKVRGPIIQAQMIETMLLLTINHQSLIATKSARIVYAAEGRPIMEFGARRAQGYDASVLGARAAYIGGVSGTSCSMAGLQFGIPVSGTMAHSFVQLYPTEYEAFMAYAKTYPDNAVLLVDTYNVLTSGVPNAIRVAKELLEPQGKRLKGIRIDSGDITYLSQESRRLLDEAGMQDCKITASSALDEYTIRDLMVQGAKVDAFGVGERLITSRSEPVFGGVYKLCGIEDAEGNVIPKMKISENIGKITNPGHKWVFRFLDRATGKAMADLIALDGEVIDTAQPYELFDPEATWKRKTLHNFEVMPLLQPIFLGGRRVYTCPSLEESRSYATRQMTTLWPSVTRLDRPHNYYVDLSQKLYDLKFGMLKDLN